MNVEEDLKDYDKREAIYKNFEDELKTINLPPATAINKIARGGKPRVSILIAAGYRTELRKEVFLENFNRELTGKGWILYQKENAFTYNYCRDKFDASINLESSSFWSEGADYWILDYSLGLRRGVLFGRDLIPEKCK
ncbi:MAG TPA: hypothetical protein VGB00_06000 [Pyrinomonadaceae bacterium]